MVKALPGAAHQANPGFHGQDTVRAATGDGASQAIATVAVFVE